MSGGESWKGAAQVSSAFFPGRRGTSFACADEISRASRRSAVRTRASMKIVLAYSGGLDTSVLLAWLKETYQAEVIAFTADVGQEEELDGLEAKALRTGAAKIFIDDLTEEF